MKIILVCTLITSCSSVLSHANTRDLVCESKSLRVLLGPATYGDVDRNKTSTFILRTPSVDLATTRVTVTDNRIQIDEPNKKRIVDQTTITSENTVYGRDQNYNPIGTNTYKVSWSSSSGFRYDPIVPTQDRVTTTNTADLTSTNGTGASYMIQHQLFVTATIPATMIVVAATDTNPFEPLNTTINFEVGLYYWITLNGATYAGHPTPSNPVRTLGTLALQCSATTAQLSIATDKQELDFGIVATGTTTERTLTMTSSGAALMPPVAYAFTPVGELSDDIVILDSQGAKIPPNVPTTMAGPENEVTVVVTGRSKDFGPVTGNLNITATVL